MRVRIQVRTKAKKGCHSLSVAAVKSNHDHITNSVSPCPAHLTPIVHTAIRGARQTFLFLSLFLFSLSIPSLPFLFHPSHRSWAYPSSPVHTTHIPHSSAHPVFKFHRRSKYTHLIWASASYHIKLPAGGVTFLVGLLPLSSSSLDRPTPLA